MARHFHKVKSREDKHISSHSYHVNPLGSLIKLRKVSEVQQYVYINSEYIINFQGNEQCSICEQGLDDTDGHIWQSSLNDILKDSVLHFMKVSSQKQTKNKH